MASVHQSESRCQSKAECGLAGLTMYCEERMVCIAQCAAMAVHYLLIEEVAACSAKQKRCKLADRPQQR